jgi:hypothetical protein
MSLTDELAMLSTVNDDQMIELQMIASADTIARIYAAVKDDEEYESLQRQINVGWPETLLRLFHGHTTHLQMNSAAAEG